MPWGCGTLYVLCQWLASWRYWDIIYSVFMTGMPWGWGCWDVMYILYWWLVVLMAWPDGRGTLYILSQWLASWRYWDIICTLFMTGEGVETLCTYSIDDWHAVRVWRRYVHTLLIAGMPWGCWDVMYIRYSIDDWHAVRVHTVPLSWCWKHWAS